MASANTAFSMCILFFCLIQLQGSAGITAGLSYYQQKRSSALVHSRMHM